MIKFPGMSSGPAGGLGETGGLGAGRVGTAVHSQPGDTNQARQQNSDLPKVAEDLLHCQLMGKMGGAGGGGGGGGAGGASPLGGLQLPRMEGGHGPVAHPQSPGGVQATGLQSPLQGAQKENGDLRKVLGDLLQSLNGGSNGASAPPQQSGLQGENDDLMKLLGDLLKSLSGGSQGAAAQPQSGVQGENKDLMKLVQDLLQQSSGAGGDSGQSSDPLSMFEQTMKENQQMKSVLGAMQSMMQSAQQSSPQSATSPLQSMLAETQQMMTQGA